MDEKMQRDETLEALSDKVRKGEEADNARAQKVLIYPGSKK